MLIHKVPWRGRDVILICGADDRGLMYALLDVAEHVRLAAGSSHPFDNIPNIAEKPAVKTRSVSNCHHYYVNHTGTRDIGQFDMTDPLERSQAECVSRRQALEMTRAMREFGGEELKDVELVATAPGLRSARRGASKTGTFSPKKTRRPAMPRGWRRRWLPREGSSRAN